ncbi:hypothetical protein K8R43_03830, partial [archaeon]|nr:hypothetical protein [archaeon]
VLEEDPLYSFYDSDLPNGKALYTFNTQEIINRDNVVSVWKQPWFFQKPIIEKASICGDGILDEGEECDGTAPYGFKCVACKLEEAYVPQCVNDDVCTAEEDLLGNCRDCQFSPIVFPNEFAPAFLWIRASAGTILLLAALVLLGALVHLWKKRSSKK